MKIQKQLDMTVGSITKGLLLFAIPFLIGNLFQEFYTVADSLIVGNFCDASALAAIGSAENPSKILLNIFMGISTGTTILISQYFGAGDENSMKEVVKTSNAFLLYVSIPLAIVGVLLSRSILSLIRVEAGRTMEYAVIYMQILMIGTPAMMGYNQNAGILRGLGDSQSPLLFLVLACIVNVVLDYILVGPLQMGVAGAAAATVLAQGVSWICSAYYIRKQYPKLQYQMFCLHVNRLHLMEIIRVGIPLGINNSVFSLGHTIVAGIINGYGTNAMAGYTCAKRLDTLVMLPMLSIGNAITSFVGQNVGAKKADRIYRGISAGCVLAVASSMILSTLILIFRRELIGLFNREEQVIVSGAAYLLRALPFYGIYAVFNTINCAMNGAREVMLPTISSMVMFWVVRLPLMFLFDRSHSLELVYWSFPISWVFGLLISGIYFLSGRWKRHMNIRQTQK